VLDALAHFPQRLRGVAITDACIAPATLRDWHKAGMRGLRFHLLKQTPGYVRGVGLDVFEVFRRTMAELGWVMQLFCDGQVVHDMAPKLREIARDLTVVVDHYGMVDAARGVNEPNFQALLKLMADGVVHLKVSAPYRVSKQYPDYADARVLHEALLRANPERLMWGTDWPHPSIAAEVMPNDGHLLDLFMDWTPDESTRRKILVDTPQRVFGG
jgi:predicted TIM-barrel fold metal-dependent hydrolase